MKIGDTVVFIDWVYAKQAKCSLTVGQSYIIRRIIEYPRSSTLLFFHSTNESVYAKRVIPLPKNGLSRLEKALYGI